MSALASSAPAAAEAAGGLSGILGELGTRMSYFAVDPFMWMYGAPMVIHGVSDALKGLDDVTDSYVNTLAREDDATGYNLAGYQKLAGQLGTVAQDLDVASGNAAVHAASMRYLGAAYDNASEQADHASSAADNLGTHLGMLEGQYGLTGDQAGQLAKAAGVSSAALQGSGDAADAAMAHIDSYAQSNIYAGGTAQQLSNDLSIFSDDALTAAARITAVDDAYTRLAGNFVSEQQAMLTVTQGFDSISLDATAAGASMTGTNAQSVALQQSFYQQAGSIEQAANAMIQAGDSTQQVTGYIGDQIGQLDQYTGHSADATQAVQDLKRWEDSLTGSLENQANFMQTTMDNELEDAIVKYSGVSKAVNDYAKAVVDFGAKSPQALNAQELMNKAIVKGGIAAGQTTTQIAQMIAKMDKIPLKEAIQIVLNAEGKYSVTGEYVPAGQGGRTAGSLLNPGYAGGGLIHSGAGSRADDVHAMLSHGEYVVQADAVSKYGVGMLDQINAKHYAGGGMVSSSYDGSAPGLGDWFGGQYGATNTILIQAIEAAMQTVIATAQSQAGTSGKPPVIVQYFGPQQPTAEMEQAMMMKISAAVGLA